ncbi:MAG TPA: hypothetical protein VK053_00415 [Jiangellaceae bacterium]|nr:hypothetical protein [Jiangellaceae bacterium]
MSSTDAFDEVTLTRTDKEKSRIRRLRGLAVFGAATVMIAATSVMAAPGSALGPAVAAADDDATFMDGHRPCYSQNPAPVEGADGVLCMFGGWKSWQDCVDMGEEAIAVSEWDHYHCEEDISGAFATFIYDTYAPYVL